MTRLINVTLTATCDTERAAVEAAETLSRMVTGLGLRNDVMATLTVDAFEMDEEDG